MKIALAHLDLTAIEEVSIDTWRTLFDEIGWPPSLAASQDGFDHDAVLNAMQKDEPSADLLLAIEAINELGTEAGRNAIHRAVEAANAGSAALPEDGGERELAVRLFLGQRKDAVLADVFARAQVEVEQHGNVRKYNEFLGREARTVKAPKSRAGRLEEVMRQYCKSKLLGDHVEVRVVRDDTALLFHVVHSHHKRNPMAVVDGQNGRAQIEYRPVHGDLLRYDASRGQLRIAARASSLVDHYRRVAGDVLFDDPEFFTGEAICTLQSLATRGRRALEHDIAGIGRVWMTECAWEHGESTLRLRAPDCFDEIERLKLPLAQGSLREAKLKLRVSGRSTRPVTVTIRVPRRIEIRGKRHEALIERFLDATGIRCRAPEHTAPGLWDLASGAHTDDEWRPVLGAHTDRLIRHGALQQVRRPVVGHPDHPDAGRVLDVHEVGAGELHGASRVGEIPSRRLSETDVVAHVIEPERFRTYLAAELDLGMSRRSGMHDGVLDLGALSIEGCQLQLYYAVVQPRVGLGQALRNASGGATPVLLLPGVPEGPPEVAQVRLASTVPTRRWVIREALIAGGCQDMVSAVHTAPERATLVVDLNRDEIWYDGILVRGLEADTHPFKFIRALADSEPHRVDSYELAARLSGGREDGNTAARQAKAKARDLIKRALREAGRPEGEDPFPSAGTGFYRCAVGAHVAGSSEVLSEPVGLR